MCLILALLAPAIESQTLSDAENKRVRLPNGWSLTPVGKFLPLGDLPLNIAIAPSHRLATVTNNGYGTQMIQLFDIQKGSMLDSAVIKKSWVGLAFS